MNRRGFFGAIGGAFAAKFAPKPSMPDPMEAVWAACREWNAELYDLVAPDHVVSPHVGGPYSSFLLLQEHSEDA